MGRVRAKLLNVNKSDSIYIRTVTSTENYIKKLDSFHPVQECL